MNSKRILLLCNGLRFGGAERQILKVAICLSAEGWDVRLALLTPPKAYMDLAANHNVRLDILSAHALFASFIAPVRLARLIGSWRPVAIISFLFHSNILAKTLGTALRIPVVITSFRNEQIGGRGRELVERLTAPLGDMAVTNSEAVAFSLKERRIASNKKLRVIPNAIESSEIDTLSQEDRLKIRETLQLSNKDFLWLAVGRLTEQKNFLSLIDAFEIVVQSHPSAQLLIVGDGPLRQVLIDRINHNKIGHLAKVIGNRDPIAPFYAACDAFVLSSKWEGMPNVLLEAMVARKPVIATDVGGVRELIHDKVTGLIASAPTANGISSAMCDIMEMSLERRDELGTAAAEHIIRNYGTNRTSDLWNRLLIDLLSAHNQSPNSTGDSISRKS